MVYVYHRKIFENFLHGVLQVVFANKYVLQSRNLTNNYNYQQVFYVIIIKSKPRKVIRCISIAQIKVDYDNRQILTTQSVAYVLCRIEMQFALLTCLSERCSLDIH